MSNDAQTTLLMVMTIALGLIIGLLFNILDKLS